MQVDRVESSLVAAVGYDADTRILVVALTDGTVYEYTGVPPGVHAELLAAPSIGRFYGMRVRGVYPTRRLPLRYQPET